MKGLIPVHGIASVGTCPLLEVLLNIHIRVHTELA